MSRKLPGRVRQRDIMPMVATEVRAVHRPRGPNLLPINLGLGWEGAGPCPVPWKRAGQWSAMEALWAEPPQRPVPGRTQLQRSALKTPGPPPRPIRPPVCASYTQTAQARRHPRAFALAVSPAWRMWSRIHRPR